MKLTDKSMEVFEYVRAHGGRATVAEIAEGVDRPARSINANINDICKKELAYRDKVEVEGDEKPVTYVQLTDAGMNFVPTED